MRLPWLAPARHGGHQNAKRLLFALILSPALAATSMAPAMTTIANSAAAPSNLRTKTTKAAPIEAADSVPTGTPSEVPAPPPSVPPKCAIYDLHLAKFTFLRFLVLGVIAFYNAHKMIRVANTPDAAKKAFLESQEKDKADLDDARTKAQQDLEAAEKVFSKAQKDQKEEEERAAKEAQRLQALVLEREKQRDTAKIQLRAAEQRCKEKAEELVKEGAKRRQGGRRMLNGNPTTFPDFCELQEKKGQSEKELEEQWRLLGEKVIEPRDGADIVALTAPSSYFLTKASTKSPYIEHPSMTSSMVKSHTKWKESCNPIQFFLALFWGGCIFIQSEGVGFVIYFAVSAVMDNYTIFFVNNTGYCKYVMAVALYSMASVTFLPNCFLAMLIQESWYDKGKWCKGETGSFRKTLFVLVMVVITVVSFVIRLKIVYVFGWIQTVEKIEEHSALSSFRVVIAVLVPPLVDGIQATLLIASGIKTEKEAQGQTDDDFSYKKLADEKDVAPAAKSPYGAAAQGPYGSPIAPQLPAVGTKGSYFSDRQDKWYDCIVTAHGKDGGVDVQLAIGEKKSIPQENLRSHWKEEYK